MHIRRFYLNDVQYTNDIRHSHWQSKKRKKPTLERPIKDIQSRNVQLLLTVGRVYDYKMAAYGLLLP